MGPFAGSLAPMVGMVKDVNKFASVSRDLIVNLLLVCAHAPQDGLGTLATNLVLREDLAKTVLDSALAKMEPLATMFQGDATAHQDLRVFTVKTNAL